MTKNHEIQISFRIPTLTSNRVEKIRAEMTRRNLNVEVEKSQVIRLAIDTGLDLLEKKLSVK